MRYFCVGIAFLVAGCQTSGAPRINDAAAAKMAEYHRTGDIVSCLNLRSISSIEAIDERALLIQSGVSNYYVSDLPQRCSGATSSFNRFQYSTSLSQLCRNEIIQIVDNSNGFVVGACGMGSFEKLEKRPK